MEDLSFRGLTSTSSSRLSASAQPFTINRSNSQFLCRDHPFPTSVSINSSIDDWQYLIPSESGIETFSLYNLEDSSTEFHSYGDSVKFKEQVFNSMPSIQPQYVRCPLGLGYKSGVSSSGNDLLGCVSGIKADDRRSSGLKENGDEGSSLALMEQGKNAIKGLKPLGNANILLPQSMKILEKENFSGSQAMEKPDNEHVSILAQNFEANSFTVSRSSGSNCILSHLSGPSNASKNYSSFGSTPLEGMYSSGCFSDNNKGYSSVCSPSFDLPRSVTNLRGRAHSGKGLELKGDERQDDKTAAGPSELIDSSVAVQPLKITCSRLFPIKTRQELIYGDGGSAIREKPCMESDSDDSDIDSPCWRGKQAAVRSPTRVVSPVTSIVLGKELERCKSLNPEAPEFVPVSLKSPWGSRPDETLEKIATLTKPLLTQEYNSLEHPVKSELCLQEVPFVSGTQSSIAITELEEADLINCKAKQLLLRGKSVAESEKAIEDAVAGDSSCSASFFSIEKPSCSLPFELGTSYGLSEKVQHVLKLLSMNSQVDVGTVTNAMHILSEFLMQNCSNELQAVKCSDHGIIQQIIRNLNSCVQNKVAGASWLGEAKCFDAAYSTMKPTYHPKNSIPEYQLTRKKTVSVPYEFSRQSTRNRCSTLMVDSKASNLHSGNGVSFDRDLIITRAMENTLLHPQQTYEDLHREALLYKNLWLESEAELRRLKYKSWATLMKAGMNTDPS